MSFQTKKKIKIFWNGRRILIWVKEKHNAGKVGESEIYKRKRERDASETKSEKRDRHWDSADRETERQRHR